MEITPFRISIPQHDLDDVKARLEHTRWTDEYEGNGWDYGTNVQYLKTLVEHWPHRFDWRQQEQRLNSFPQFTVELDGEAMTFIHVRANAPNPTPLLLLHGWPDSVCRYLKLIPLLTDGAGRGDDPDVCFDVVVPWLIGRLPSAGGSA